ncbi:MAG: DUF58 domain-containing protein [Candidatus Dependentiae bacterium]
MVSQEVLRKIKEIEIIARRLVSSKRIGSASSAQKGVGFEFDQLREYQPGDDVRAIDWNSSARSQKLLVKQYIEERNRTIFIVLDITASMAFSSQEKLKFDLASQIAALLALVGNYGKDKIGLILFGQVVETYRPAKMGRSWVWQIIHDIFSAAPSRTKTNISQALMYLNRIKEKNAIVFVISDFIDSSFQKSLKTAALKHEIVAICVMDQREFELPNCGIYHVLDVESGQVNLLDTRNSCHINSLLRARLKEQENFFQQGNTSMITVFPGEQALHQVANFFTRKMRY